MADIIPFRGIRYAASHELASLVAPPYDVLGVQEVKSLQVSGPHNITHVTRPSGESPYETAAETWKSWQEGSVVVADESPALYIYRQNFVDPDTGADYPERIGLVALLKIEDYSTGKVLPHENTLTAARADRMKLLEATHANLESIYGLYSDPNMSIARAITDAASNATFVGEVPFAIGSSHSLQRLDDPEAIDQITSLFRDRPIFIADGHHRYETSLNFHKAHADLPGSDTILITLTAFEDEGLLVLPTHRLLNGLDTSLVSYLPSALADAGFEVHPADEGAAASFHTFVMVLVDGTYTVRYPQNTDSDQCVPGDQSKALKDLDVSILHTLVIGNLLGVPLDLLSTTDKVKYTRDADEAKELVRTGKAQAAFLLGRPSVDEIKSVSEAGDKMPQKSTFFYPKLLSGLVMRNL